MRLPSILAAAIVGLVFGFVLGRAPIGDEIADQAGHARNATVGVIARGADLDTRMRVLLEHPRIIPQLAEGGGFGGRFSRVVAQNMFSRLPEAIEDARAKTEILEIADRTWLIRLPIVNAVLFETDEGLVLVDTGMAPGGPAILDAMRSVSDAPLHTIIYTHGHVDHAYGTWAFLEAGETPEIVAQERLPLRFDRYIRLRGSIARYMSQPLGQLPTKREDFAWPTLTFANRLELEIGGEEFILQHFPGETDDQLFVWVPSRGTIASADYYQGFLPNAGNGKRVQRYVEEWIQALRAIVALEPAVLLPAHGAAITDPAEIRENLTVLADALEFIVDETIRGLNDGLRKDQIHASIQLPDALARHPTLNTQYVSAADVSKMVIRRYTGWWDDVPSHWSPAPLPDRARAIVELAGGIDALAGRARELADRDLPLACHLADWAFLANPESPVSQSLVIDLYEMRILDPTSNTQEMLAYLDAMVEAREAQLRPESD